MQPIGAKPLSRQMAGKHRVWLLEKGKPIYTHSHREGNEKALSFVIPRNRSVFDSWL